VDYNESVVDEHEPTLATPVDSLHTTPSPAPHERQEEEVPNIYGNDDVYDSRLWRDDRRRRRSFSDEKAEAETYFNQYITYSFHPDDITADKKIRVIYPLVKPPAAIRHEGARPSAEPL
jgi:hypothetical protein